jgi:nitroreductase
MQKRSGGGMTTDGETQAELTPVEAAIRGRRSVRRWKDQEVPRDLIVRVLEAGRWAPSAVNLQPWHFVVVTEPERRTALAKATAVAGVSLMRHVAKAPVLIALCGDQTRSPAWYVHDCCLASENLMLAAHALGLGTCWVGAFDEGTAAEALGIADGIRVVGLITLGYPAQERIAPTPRLPLEDIVHWQAFREGAGTGVRGSFRRGRISLLKRLTDFLGR